MSSPELKDAVVEVLPTLREQHVSVFLLSKECDTEGIEALTDSIEKASEEPVSPALRSKVTMGCPSLYIYTSGTIGVLAFALCLPHDEHSDPNVLFIPNLMCLCFLCIYTCV